MSSRAVHEAAAAVNLDLAKRLQERGWRVTAIYYAAVQKVEARLADGNDHPGRHEDRFAAALIVAPTIAVPWRKLKQLSEDWRYRGIDPTEQECQDAERWAATIALTCGETWPEPTP